MKQYSRIFQYLKAYKSKIFLYFLFVLLSIIFSIISIGMLMPFLQLIFLDGKGITTSSSNAVIQYVNNFLYTSVTTNGKIYTLGIICLLMVSSIILKNLFLYLSYYVLNPLKNQIVNHLREELYDKVLRLPIGFFNEKRKGDLMSRMTNDVSEVEGSVVGTLEGWIRDPMTIIVTLTVLLLISVQLTLFILILIPVLGLVIGRVTKSLKKHSEEVATKYGETLSTLDETLGGLRVIKAFNIEKLLRGKFFKSNEELLTAKNKISFRRDLASPLSEVMGVILFTAVLYYGGRLVLRGELLEASAFLGFLGIFYNIIGPAKALSTSFSNMRKGAAAINRIEDILNTPITVDDNPTGKKIDSFEHSIEFRNVSFAYADAIILDNINLIVKKGQTVALVGSSGAGKSTLADLVPRFHDVTSGEVLIDGINIKDYSLFSARSLMSIVTQEPILFNDTISNNIAIGQQEATEEQIIEAAKIANAHEFIIKKEGGYHSNIGDRGAKLSGGERQRLTIARAVLKNPPILILDEATSSLDTESERLVQDAINNMMQNRTSIVIAHRLSTIRHADEIIVLQKGKIVERGNHEELLAQGGFYKKLVDMQEVR
ncbi:MAG: ABC transporter ATP-binding protein [Chitinophagaceae bacterium]|nr:ABC transporter ATP-binding protein [Chitinophagaceae bacterium]MBP6478742.1 ABC transporter ATP-binding protein [Chitinophagaceae bacterium]MBP7107458.1 ABC transporter ATP-binding protein [Chitinophagaceae bacterium]MBP7315753.1 ABC transporter ATP-binding protein [Chitinophagaceae bacterium]HQV56071.1 ABC transporter ATP-binding protein [Chitinophagaceae bacterium]